jgi:hypothetical protein
MTMTYRDIRTPLTLAALVLTRVAYAQGGATGGAVNGVQVAVNIFCKVANLMFNVAMIVGIIFAILAAFKYMTAAGDTTKVSEAHKTLTYAIVGIGVAIIAGGVPAFIATFLGAGSVTGCP